MKKLLSILTAILLISTIVSVGAMSASARSFVPNNNSFKPRTDIIIPLANGPIEVDAKENVVDEGYGSYSYLLEGKLGSTQADCIAYIAYDAINIYILMDVNDPTKSANVGGSFNSDSIEFYLDFDNNKTQYNVLSNEKLYAGQFRVQRGGNTVDPGVVGDDNVMEKLRKKSVAKTTEKKNGGYIVEISFPHGDYPLSNKIGFALQVNDSESGNRVAQLFTNKAADAQDHCYEYTHLLDTATLEDFTPTTNRAKAPDAVDPEETTQVIVSSAAASSKPSTASSKPSTASSKPSTASSKPSTASSKPDTAASAASSAVTSAVESTAASTAASDVTSSNVTAPVESSIGGAVSNSSTAAPTASTASSVSVADVEADANASTPDTAKDGGLPIAALIAIIAGGVAILAGGAIAVILILKKKGAVAEGADATDTNE